MSDEDLTRCLLRYFKEPAIDRKDLARLITIIQDFAMRGLQLPMVQKIFRMAETCMGKDNLKVIIKRYFHIMNEILDKDEQVEAAFRYRDAISAEIVHQFIAMLRNVLSYGPMDLMAEMKLYRKRWAKRITDQAYAALQSQASKQLKLDLDKGFSDENVRKLSKLYQKRQFSKSDFEKYLPATNTQASESRKGSTFASSQSQGEERPRKKTKKQSQERVAEKRNQSSDMVMPRHSSFIPSNSNSNTFGNGIASDRRPNQFTFPPSYQPQPLYAPGPYPPNHPNQRVITPVLAQPPYYPQPPNPYHPNSYPYGYPNYPLHSGMNPNLNPSYNISLNPQHNAYQGFSGSSYVDPRTPTPLQISSKLSKLLAKIEAVKSNWALECKACGVLISTNQKYEQHMSQHFIQSQKHYEISHNRTDHTRKPAKPLLPSAQQWIHENRTKLWQKKFQVAIQNEIKGNETCVICKGELKVSWSDGLDCWVYEDAIRTRNREMRKFVCHAQCYHAIDQFQRSCEEAA